MMETLTLSSGSLLSKWGFGDGSMPDPLLDELDERDIPYPEDWHAVLGQLVTQYLLPALDQDVEVVVIETNHNPIRARLVDGTDVVDQWRVNDPQIRLTPDHVSVPIDRVIELIRSHTAV